MKTAHSLRHSEVFVWTLIGLLAMALVLVALTRVAGTAPGKLAPVTTYIVSPFHGTFVAGTQRGGQPAVEIGTQLKAETVVGNVEVRGRLRPVYSMVRGTVVEVLVFDEAFVLPRQPLFKVQIETEPTPA